jgi:hypothetical protein
MTVTNPAPLPPRQAAALLGTMPIILQAEFKAAPEGLLRWRPAPEEWCLLEVVGHLIETEERGFAGRIRTILAAERPKFTTWDPTTVARERQDGQRDPTDLLAEFTSRRTASVTLVEGLAAADLDRGGDHPEVGFLTVSDLLHEWIHYDANHLRQMLDNIQTFTWPSMGNAQRFTAPDPSSNGSG